MARMLVIAASLAASLISSTVGMYAGSDVVELTPKNFQKEVMKSDSVWIIEFYAPW